MAIPSRKTTLRVCALLLVMAALCAPLSGGESVWAGDRDFELTVLHTNDVHARILEADKNGSICFAEKSDSDECYGGVARLASKLKEIRKQSEHVLLLDAGDQFQGTLFFTYYKGSAIQQFMNELGYQAMTVGNHEFDKGPEVLAEFIGGVKFPVLGANLDVGGDPHLKGLIKPYCTVTVGGQTIGVVGYTAEHLRELSQPGPHVVEQPIESSVATALEAFKKQGVDKVIALSHAGFGRDKEIAARLDGIDVIVGGHTHTFLSNTDPTAQGPYPVVVKSPGGHPVLIVTAAAWGKYLGRLDVTFDAKGQVKSWNGNPLLLDSSVPEDPEIRAEALKLSEPLVALQKEIIGTSELDLRGDARCRFEECNLGNLIADAMIAATSATGAQIALQNGGGIRAGMKKGPISRGQILQTLPFGNFICTVQLKGADILAALENGVSRADGQTKEGTGRFLQVSGLRYAWDPQRATGSRVVKVEVKQADGSYQALIPEAVYVVVTNNFLRYGGDGYEVFADKGIGSQNGPILDEALLDYIKAHSPINVGLDNRITRIGGSKP
jgi:5'-nucleotidase / UDP-sugar diphosphatase